MLLHCNCHKYMMLFCCSFSINDSTRLDSTVLCSFSNVTLNDDTLLLLLLLLHACLYNGQQTKQLIQAERKGKTVQFSSAQLSSFSLVTTPGYIRACLFKPLSLIPPHSGCTIINDKFVKFWFFVVIVVKFYSKVSFFTDFELLGWICWLNEWHNDYMNQYQAGKYSVHIDAMKSITLTNNADMHLNNDVGIVQHILELSQILSFREFVEKCGSTTFLCNNRTRRDNNLIYFPIGCHVQGTIDGNPIILESILMD